jgi:GMP synthase-like glutamine amidotransferase
MKRSFRSLCVALVVLLGATCVQAVASTTQPASTGSQASRSTELTAPVLATAPRLDQVVTGLTPLMSWANSEGGSGTRTYTLEIDTTPKFNSRNLRQYSGIKEDVHITSFHLPEPLEDDRQYFWRVRASDAEGNRSGWGAEIGGITARFHVRSDWDEKFFGVRVPVAAITASSGTNAAAIQSYQEDGLDGWTGAPGESSHWVQFDLGEAQPVSRIWMLFKEPGWKPRNQTRFAFVTRPTDLSGRLASYEWQSSNDGRTWRTVPGTRVRNADGYRNYAILDDKPVTARYFRLAISRWHGEAPRVNEVTFYRAGPAPAIQAPEKDYVIVVGNFRSDQSNRNSAFRDAVLGLNGHVRGNWDLEVLEIPAYNISLAALEALKKKPVAIFLTGFSRWQEMQPEFEYNGLYEIIRSTQVPLYGACGGLQLMAQQSDYTYARDTGRFYGTGLGLPPAEALKRTVDEDVPAINIVKHDPVFAGLVTPFYGPESHGWKVAVVPEGFEVLATSVDSKGLTVVELMRAKDRMIYGTQFHAENAQAHSAAKLLLVNFIHMALARQR